MSRRAGGMAVVAVILVTSSCGQHPAPAPSLVVVEPEVPGSLQSPPPPPQGPIGFRELEDAGGIRFLHCSGNDPQKYFPTSLGSGVTLLDYDGDGRLDVYLTTTRNLPSSAPDRSMGNRLYRNLGGLRFQDVTEATGTGYRGFCHGAAVGDVNNDGRPDLYLTNLGGNRLFLNEGGRFRDATAGSGTEIGLWSSGAAFLDYDRDGVLDLYVTCYGVWSETDDHPYCGDQDRNIRVICSPFSITPQRHFLFKGRGDGTFVETTSQAGVLRKDGRGLGVVAADVNRDGWIDLYVANDGCPNFLFLNNKGGGFADVSESSGAAFDESGQVQGSMGVDIQDVDRDGWPELFVTNFRGQYNTLYHNVRGESFVDASGRAGIIKDSRSYVGWGCALADFDNDGTIDMFVVNGEVDDNLREIGQDIDYDQPAVVWRGSGDGRFRKIANPGPFFQRNHPARGAAFGDLDEDGDLDVVVGRMDQPVAVLINESPRHHWIRLDLVATRSNRSAIGTSVVVHAGGREFHHQRKGGDSYLSANDPRILVGLGEVERVDRVEIHWPNGERSELVQPEVDRTHRVEEPR